ncbi:MAG: PAS domain-containing protein [Alphaproteobacteria bacterium]|nr:MAG: PAS domain-containing protein [Alphaproteobacteria bacterium]
MDDDDRRRAVTEYVAVLPLRPDGRPDWDAAPEVREMLADVAGFDARAATLSDGAETALSAPTPEGEVVLRIRRAGETLRVHQMLTRRTGAAMGGDKDVPVPAWTADPDGNVLWANRAYRELSRALDKEGSGTALPNIFGQVEAGARVRVETADGRAKWFDILAGDRGTFCATPADAAVEAEERRKSLSRALVKTFSDLDTGLALFDSDGQLVTFNPALGEMTGISPAWLSARPGLRDFLDRLRSDRIMPEPRDFEAWRQRVTELRGSAASDLVTETWSLPNGRTWRFSARPHPDGGLAILLDDITAELALARHFRTELDVAQAVIDQWPDAVAVFSPDEALVMSNAAYARLWGIDPSVTLGQIDLTEATRHWQGMCRPTPVWGDFRDFAVATEDRAEWSADVELGTGEPLHCRFVPLPAGHTLATFQRLADETGRPGDIRHYLQLVD